MAVGGQRHAPAAIPPVKTRYPLYRRLGGPQGRSGEVRKTSSPPGFDPRTVHPRSESRLVRGELSYLAPLGSENISAPYFKQCFFRGEGGVLPPRLSQTPRLPVPRQK